MKASRVWIKYALVISTVLMASCGSTGRKQQLKLRNLVKSGDFKAAESYVKGSKFFPEEESRLLKLVELGTIQYLNNNLYQALKSFDRAKSLSDKLFTVSISKKVKAAVSNDNTDNYYGEKYERSMIRYYQALTHYLLFQTGKYEAHEQVQRDKKGKVVSKKPVAAKELSDKERRFHLNAAKNVLIEWNSLLDNYKATTGGKVAYKDDLLAKVFGAFIHEQLGGRRNLTIARDLYKAAKKVLFRNFNVLATYNALNQKFRKDLKKLPNLPESKVRSDYVKETPNAKALLDYIDERLLSLKKGQKSNLFVMVENGFIQPKKADVVKIPLPFTGRYRSAGGNFVKFCLNVLGQAYGTMPRIAYEIPRLPYSPIGPNQKLLIQQNGKTIVEKSLAVVNPLSDLAHVIMDEKSSATAAKIGARVAGKHIAALFLAYGTYQAMRKNGTPDAGALFAAGLAYGVSNKAIESSEKADLRSWGLLPHHYRLTSLNLKPGSYDLILYTERGDQSTQKRLKSIEIASNKPQIVAFRSY